jgi:Fe-S-cluster containining protein
MTSEQTNAAPTCRRCGTCCEQGGPALHGEDRELIDSGALGRNDLVTIRRGEPAYDQRQGRVVAAEQEFLKLAGARGSWRCKFHVQPGSCGIYGQRPLECRLLFCQDTAALEAVMGRDLLSRRELLAGDDPALEWLAKLELEVVYQEVLALLAELRQPASAPASLAQLTGLVRADLALRESFLHRFPQRGAEELFLLGRPLFLVIAPYGCRLVEDRNGVELQHHESRL